MSQELSKVLPKFPVPPGEKLQAVMGPGTIPEAQSAYLVFSSRSLSLIQAKGTLSKNFVSVWSLPVSQVRTISFESKTVKKAVFTTTIINGGFRFIAMNGTSYRVNDQMQLMPASSLPIRYMIMTAAAESKRRIDESNISCPQEIKSTLLLGPDEQIVGALEGAVSINRTWGIGAAVATNKRLIFLSRGVFKYTGSNNAEGLSEWTSYRDDEAYRFIGTFPLDQIQQLTIALTEQTVRLEFGSEAFIEAFAQSPRVEADIKAFRELITQQRNSFLSPGMGYGGERATRAYCSNCGAANEAMDRFCASCGVGLQ